MGSETQTAISQGRVLRLPMRMLSDAHYMIEQQAMQLRSAFQGNPVASCRLDALTKREERLRRREVPLSVGVETRERRRLGMRRLCA